MAAALKQNTALIDLGATAMTVKFKRRIMGTLGLEQNAITGATALAEASGLPPPPSAVAVVAAGPV